MKNCCNFLLVLGIILASLLLVDSKHFGIGSRRKKAGNFFGCDCGAAEKGADNARPNLSSPYTLPKLRREHSKKTRIVGGYTPKVRPWMALLELKPKPQLATRKFGGRQKNAQCGGALINKVTFYNLRNHSMLF